ncbi:hypothetical protein NZK32_11045 [Cyanobium sp. FGCU-52]|nr:hypothetical protein [Cyanobium sp. FGCU52]
MPNSIALNGSDNYTGTFVDTDYTTTAFTSGPVSFDWDYSSDDDPFFDGFGYLLNVIFTQLAISPSAGSTQFNVVAGDVFGFRVYATDDCCGRASVAISNFSAPIPVPGPLPLMGVGAAFSYSRRLRRRTSQCHGPLGTASHIRDQD